MKNNCLVQRRLGGGGIKIDTFAILGLFLNYSPLQDLYQFTIANIQGWCVHRGDLCLLPPAVLSPATAQGPLPPLHCCPLGKVETVVQEGGSTAQTPAIALLI